MHWVDWTLVMVPLVLVVWVGLRTQRYVKGVADFLTAGRVAGRYVLCVSSGEAGMGLISLIALYESYYQSGFAYGFWGSLATPVFLVLGLTGYCSYRFRETRAMTVGQFLEIRYSRRFRNFAGVLQSISGVVNFALFPAVGARFIVYFCGLPIETELAGMVFPTFALVMAICLGLEAFVAIKGGQITVMVTNCIQGLLSYPLYLVIVLFVLLNFSWFRDMAPAILDRPPGKSLINPFDIAALRDFNLLYVIIGILSGVINRMSWSGNLGYSVSGRNAHEQKMAGVLGTWRSGFEVMMFLLLAIVGLTYLNSDRYQDGPRGAVACRTDLAIKAFGDVAAGVQFAPVRKDIVRYLETGVITPGMQGLIDRTAALKVTEEAEKAKLRFFGREEAAPGTEEDAASKAVPSANAAEARQLAREARVDMLKNAIRAVDPGASQTYGTIFGQMRVPMALRYLMPIGIIGIFAFLCIFQMVTCDSSYMLSWGSILVQDVILPLRRKPFSPAQQLLLLRILISAVATFAFFFSYFFGQVDYILMFFAITGAIWLGGSGPCIVGGLYWKRGTTAGAWAALISGSTLAVAAILVQKYWVPAIYPWLHAHGMVETLAIWLTRCSAPFEPIIKWRMSSEKFPINSQEVYGLTMLISIGLYVIVSLLTSTRGRVFNMERMLHRGQYHREGIRSEKPRLTWRTLYVYLLGIDNQYTRSDKILAWSVFLWSFVWGFLCCFVGVAVWNVISPWGNAGWSRWFFINNFCVAGAVAAVSTVWFTIGGTRDLRRLFRDLKRKETNALDNGRVVGHVSADDVALVERVEQAAITVTEEESR